MVLYDENMSLPNKSEIRPGPKPRLIPVLLLKDGLIVRSQLFQVHQVIGNPISTTLRYSNWNVDELIILDISSGIEKHDLRRDDLQQSYDGFKSVDVLREISKVSFMPLTFGGRLRNIKDIEKCLEAGADKVTLNTAIYDDSQFLIDAARRFGSQCIVASVDAKQNETGSWDVFVNGGKINTKKDVRNWAKFVEECGAGEIFLNSIDRDGSAIGYDIDLIRYVTKCVEIPVIACGGVGSYPDIPKAIVDGGASAVAVANLFHFYELSYQHAKKVCFENGLNMRDGEIGSKYLAREPVYDVKKENNKLNLRIEKANNKDFKINKHPHNIIKWCKQCTYPSISAAPMEFNSAGVCTGCQMAKVKESIKKTEWKRRKELLQKLVNRYKSNDGSRHDVVVAVSGGKDSYFQVHYLKEELGLNPLLVTYDGNNWTDVGWRNMCNMRDAFGVDHIIVRPSVTTLKKLNKLAFYIMGDMNWHAHVGIMTTPMREAANRSIPLVFYGEHGYLDLCGQFSMNDFPEVTYRDRLEHFARGYEWNYFLNRYDLKASELDIWKYPSDKKIFDLDLRGIFLGNYVYWEANEHIDLVKNKYGFETSKQNFDRTYRTMSNLDDMHENGIHDYLKYIKFGYGRATDHTCKDIRAGIMTRDEGVKLVNKYDPVKPSDLKRWLDYVGISEEEFDDFADTFRDPRVWQLKNNKWIREELN